MITDSDREDLHRTQYAIGRVGRGGRACGRSRPAGPQRFD